MALVAQMSTAAAAAPERAVAFQGAPGSNSHIAVTQAYPDSLPLPCFSFEDAIDAVREQRAGFAVIPIENSLHGRVADMHYLLPESGLFITGEHFLPISHCLIGNGTVSEVTEVMSHPQALGQTRKWLRGRGMKPVAFPDTAGAVAALAESGAPSNVAALAPRLAAEIYGLPIIEENIADNAYNTTRFLSLSREAATQVEGARCITTLMFAVRNAPASLYKALGSFATNGINITKLESYQRDGLFQASEFYCDVEGHANERSLTRALDELAFHSRWTRILGTCPRFAQR